MLGNSVSRRKPDYIVRCDLIGGLNILHSLRRLAASTVTGRIKLLGEGNHKPSDLEKDGNSRKLKGLILIELVFFSFFFLFENN